MGPSSWGGVLDPVKEDQTSVLGLFFADWRCSFLDQGCGLSRLGFILEAEHGRISLSHHLRHQEAEIDPRLTNRLCDGMAEPLPIVPLDQQGGNRRRGKTSC